MARGGHTEHARRAHLRCHSYTRSIWSRHTRCTPDAHPRTCARCVADSAEQRRESSCSLRHRATGGANEVCSRQHAASAGCNEQNANAILWWWRVAHERGCAERSGAWCGTGHKDTRTERHPRTRPTRHVVRCASPSPPTSGVVGSITPCPSARRRRRPSPLRNPQGRRGRRSRKRESYRSRW